MNEKLRDLARSSYGKTLIEWFTSDIEALMQPDEIPDENVEQVKAYKMQLIWLMDKRDHIRRLREVEEVIPIEDETE